MIEEEAEGRLVFFASRVMNGKKIFMILAVIAIVFLGLLANIPAIYLGKIVDEALNVRSDAFSSIAPYVGIIAASMILKEAFTIVRKYCIEKIAITMERDEFANLVRHILSVDVQYLSSIRVGALNIRIHRSIEGLIKLFKLMLLDFAPTMVVALVAVVIASQHHLFMLGIIGCVMGASAIITYYQIATQKGIRLNLFKIKEDIGAHLTELLNGLDYVRATGLQNYEARKTEKHMNDLGIEEIRHHKWMMGFDGIKQLIEGLGFLSVIIIGALSALDGIISKGEVLTLAVLYKAATTPLQDLHRILDEGYEAMLKVAELLALYKMPKDSGLEASIPPSQITDLSSIIEANDLTVNYTTVGAPPALDGINVKIAPGERIGIVGASGSGKSTFVKMILGLTPRYGGSLKVMGVEVRDLAKSELTKTIAYAPQRPFILAGTVRENLDLNPSNRLGSDTQLWGALDDARLSQKIRTIMGNLDAPIFEHGRNLSGGEQQRLMLARVFLQQGKLVILDEATSALDNETEAEIQCAIHDRTLSSTVIVIAHRISTLHWTDRILVFREGKIVQEGKFEALAQEPGVFRQLLQRQYKQDFSEQREAM